MSATPETIFHYEVEESEGSAKEKVTTIRCHGRLVSSTADQLKDLVKPRIASCKAGQSLRIIIDFADLAYMDSSGLGAVVGLKVSSLTRGDGCSLELVHLSPRVAELLRLANLTQLFYLKPNPGSAFAFHAEALNASHRTTEPENK